MPPRRQSRKTAAAAHSAKHAGNSLGDSLSSAEITNLEPLRENRTTTEDSNRVDVGMLALPQPAELVFRIPAQIHDVPAPVATVDISPPSMGQSPSASSHIIVVSQSLSSNTDEERLFCRLIQRPGPKRNTFDLVNRLQQSTHHAAIADAQENQSSSVNIPMPSSPVRVPSAAKTAAQVLASAPVPAPIQVAASKVSTAHSDEYLRRLLTVESKGPMTYERAKQNLVTTTRSIQAKYGNAPILQELLDEVAIARQHAENQDKDPHAIRSDFNERISAIQHRYRDERRAKHEERRARKAAKRANVEAELRHASAEMAAQVAAEQQQPIPTVEATAPAAEADDMEMDSQINAGEQHRSVSTGSSEQHPVGRVAPNSSRVASNSSGSPSGPSSIILSRPSDAGVFQQAYLTAMVEIQEEIGVTLSSQAQTAMMERLARNLKIARADAIRFGGRD
ncbi:hypothetical protein GQ43DRAFT_469428 [Delitschia confertaspora ATCC 74209]|uniref:Uncharacterized protein n=1 Tax=Delitschia confertaspora ATCC 74209 TaxID=1513339 RepID=A0A9P4JVL0_9PLEO|nr:hypothetical protein GQ43DRAFT_469428 [Delitschia confertaspora ATCC 74209]